MNRLTILIVISCLVVGSTAGLLCSALDDAAVPGVHVYRFFAGLISVVSGGAGILLPLAWLVDRYSVAGRRERSCV